MKAKFDFWAIPAIIPAVLFLPLPWWTGCLIAGVAYLLRNTTIIPGTVAVVGLNIAALIFAIKYVPAWYSFAFFVLFAVIIIVEIVNVVEYVKSIHKVNSFNRKSIEYMNTHDFDEDDEE